MPGLLFHHVTPTKDYIHDRMKPWTHYVPVAVDLRDLRRKYEWAERNPNKAKRIAEQGSNLMRYLGSPEGFERTFRRDMVEPLRRVIEAYRPVGGGSSAWRHVLRDMEGEDRILPVIKCTGWEAARNWLGRIGSRGG